MLIQLLIGAVAMAVVWLLFSYARKRNLTLTWWQWAATVLGVIYAVFVLEVIVGFLQEGEPRAALVMGLITGIFAVVWGVLLGRFVFFKASKTS